MVRNGHSVILFPKWLLSNITYGTKWLETRQFGTKTVRHPLEKTVRHQDISAPVEKDSSAPRHFGPVEKSVKSAPHFLSNKRDYLFFK